MTAADLRPARMDAPALAVRARDMLALEWVKLRSLRSNYVTLLVASAATLGITVVVARAVTSAPAHGGGSPFPPLTASFLAYAEYAVLPVCVLSVLGFTAEYSTGLIRITFTAAPRRWAVLAAKATVLGGSALVAGEVLAFACFFLTQGIMSASHHGLSLSDPGVPGAVLAAGYLLCACALTALGLGAIIRHTAGAITATVAVIYGVAGLCLLLPSPWKDDIGRFTITFAAFQVLSPHQQHGLLSPSVSMLVLIAWPAAILLAAGTLLAARDA